MSAEGAPGAHLDPGNRLYPRHHLVQSTVRRRLPRILVTHTYIHYLTCLFILGLYNSVDADTIPVCEYFFLITTIAVALEQ